MILLFDIWFLQGVKIYPGTESEPPVYIFNCPLGNLQYSRGFAKRHWFFTGRGSLPKGSTDPTKYPSAVRKAKWQEQANAS